MIFSFGLPNVQSRPDSTLFRPCQHAYIFHYKHEVVRIRHNLYLTFLRLLDFCTVAILVNKDM